MKKFNLAAALMFLLWAQAGALAAGISLEDNKFMYSDYSKRISMDFKDAALSEVLKIFSQQSGKNFIAASDVTGKRVTLFFENIPIEEALDKILSANGLTYEIQPGSDTFVVKDRPAAGQNLVTKFYQLKYASVSSSKINSTISITSNGGGSTSASSGGSSGGSSSSGGGAPAAGAAGGASGGSSGIVSAVRAVLSQYGKLTEDPRTNTLIITDMEPQFAMIEDTLKRLDVAIPQILIQVEMLDVSKGTIDLIGVKYGDTILSLTGAKRSVSYPWDLHLIQSKGFVFPSPEYVPGLLDTSTMKAMVQFLETQSDTKNLARPRLMTLNNETAQIKIATSEAIGLKTQTQATSGGTSTQSLEAERVETGVFLLVTPQANPSTGEITLAVAPKVIQARTGATFEGKTFKDPEERGSQQLMKIKSGDTVVIGGLLRTDTSSTITKLPILGDLPLIGRAFRHTDKNKTERELLIFITPSIVDENNKDQLLAVDKNDHLIDREQDIPKSRLKQIDKELSSMENERF
jgi:type II secretory pathway component GspD/PulD (secretin)